MLFDKDTPIKKANDDMGTWDDETKTMLLGTNHKIKIILLGVLVITLFIISGFYRLYPLDRQTDFFMVVNDEDHGNYLIEQARSDFVVHESNQQDVEQEPIVDSSRSESNELSKQVRSTKESRKAQLEQAASEK